MTQKIKIFGTFSLNNQRFVGPIGLQLIWPISRIYIERRLEFRNNLRDSNHFFDSKSGKIIGGQLDQRTSDCLMKKCQKFRLSVQIFVKSLVKTPINSSSLYQMLNPNKDGAQFMQNRLIKDRAVERAWKAWQFHGARGWKGGPQITKAKEKWDNQKKLSHFGP